MSVFDHVIANRIVHGTTGNLYTQLQKALRIDYGSNLRKIVVTIRGRVGAGRFKLPDTLPQYDSDSDATYRLAIEKVLGYPVVFALLNQSVTFYSQEVAIEVLVHRDAEDATFTAIKQLFKGEISDVKDMD